MIGVSYYSCTDTQADTMLERCIPAEFNTERDSQDRAQSVQYSMSEYSVLDPQGLAQNHKASADSHGLAQNHKAFVQTQQALRPVTHYAQCSIQHGRA